MKLVITISIFLYLIVLCQAVNMDESTEEELKKFIEKGLEIYKWIEEEEKKLHEAFEKSQLNDYIDSEPEVNANESDKDEVKNSDPTKTLMKIAWNVARKMMKKSNNELS
ncbi:uncharacterized protein LOC129576807 [Sitodiplosis mosellana]|uniref:uncharacterized protein LOC129576807 n=1 Tax=Sitodiplosis mosellana TaxID=263140 RepID=UPI00244490ED|nr:uncharacterized protein LOC129576807 [Sitodiplosis mosellana]